MNTKKIWMLAIIFGMIMSLFVYILAANPGDTNQTVNTTTIVEEAEAVSDVEHGHTIEIESGKRAISISVTEVQNVSGFVTPGSYVDVVAILPIPVSEITSSQILLQGIKVLAVGKTFNDEQYELNQLNEMVTLEVTPEQGTSLAFAKEIGSITLMLRGEEDKEVSSNVQISLEELIKGKMPK
ncbi:MULTISPECIES: Flp pilus assembly protein CpaB [Bacillaceae]|uniref:Flp pilus assembly protein CpaB n=1 Tax=Evansella alkalicola TaxID=745819 RepID=A0ABS6JRX8_9BACI|nr:MULTISPECIES: Flp pilus assembly protein CpaB [Bacillaceae]MBU9721318.1 Flp pilus assembly protein CpaB [Bacillus alkalicola]